MLSGYEYKKLHDQLAHIPKSFTAQQRKNFQRSINKKLKEHFYASQYPPFEPTPYELIFINRATTPETLTRLITIIGCSTLFTLDTESTNILYQPNKPSLIQIQIIPPEDISIIMFVEVCHLPRSDQYEFTLIKQLFNVLLQSTKIIFTWGELDELDTFTQYGLFTTSQIHLPSSINIQTKFRTYWSNNYPHQSTEPLNDTLSCKCLSCFGITHDNLISIQDAVAISLNRWIDKRLTRNPFDIGLDPRLKKLNDKELEYRQHMSIYAANDCDAIKQIIIHTNIINEIQPPIESYETILLIDDLSPLHSPEITLVPEVEEASTQSTSAQTRASTFDLELEPISDDDGHDNLILYPESTSNRIVTINESTLQRQTSTLPLAERKRIHNRQCTLRQRRRLYQNKITCYNIDPRFAIRKIKQMLDDHHIPFTAVNTVKSTSTNTTTLYIGVKDPSLIQQHGAFLKTLFNTKSYNKIYKRNYNYVPTHNRYSSR